MTKYHVLHKHKYTVYKYTHNTHLMRIYILHHWILKTVNLQYTRWTWSTVFCRSFTWSWWRVLHEFIFSVFSPRTLFVPLTSGLLPAVAASPVTGTSRNIWLCLVNVNAGSNTHTLTHTLWLFLIYKALPGSLPFYLCTVLQRTNIQQYVPSVGSSAGNTSRAEVSFLPEGQGSETVGQFFFFSFAFKLFLLNYYSRGSCWTLNSTLSP